MLTLHHLNDSRSQRVLWLLEEIGVPYELIRYQRDAKTNLAPPELKAIHPLGKSPVIVDGTRTIAESGVIVEYLVRKYGGGRFAPAVDIDSDDYLAYLHWMHYAEGSAMVPVLLQLYVSRLGDAGAPLSPRIESEMRNHFGYMNQALQGREFFVGNALSGADVQMSFVVEAAASRGPVQGYPNLVAFMDRVQARPAYQRALQRGGPYRFAKTR
jgi:glutathione S-transferase